MSEQVVFASSMGNSFSMRAERAASLISSHCGAFTEVGLLERGLTYAGAKALSVTLLEPQEKVARYEIRWA